jgi:CBS domain containing-hemolysin-like protein
LIQEGYSRIPIYEWWMDNIIWRVLLKDIMSFALLWKDTKLDKLMRPIQFVPESMKVADCLRLLQSTHIHIAVVSSEHGTTLWLVTLEDIVEELVWDIHDESDEQTSIVTLQDDWSFLVDAWASIVDVNDSLPMPLPESENYDTISGYINTLFGRIPSVNESIDTDHYMITILKTKKQRVETVKLELLAK